MLLLLLSPLKCIYWVSLVIFFVLTAAVHVVPILSTPMAVSIGFWHSFSYLFIFVVTVVFVVVVVVENVYALSSFVIILWALTRFMFGISEVVEFPLELGSYFTLYYQCGLFDLIFAANFSSLSSFMLHILYNLHIYSSRSSIYRLYPFSFNFILITGIYIFGAADIIF